ncbi:hypothetical protein [Thioclava kandeliae]|uniref:DUF892 family protein n=1 Tax=Thioclava kandeliae TaxID=3070818 RepID=A0ABV1SC64_9RHOB
MQNAVNFQTTGVPQAERKDTKSLIELIRRYDYIEGLCDRVLTEQQAKMSRYHQMISEERIKSALRGTMDIPERPPVHTSETAEIEELETEVRIYRYQLNTLESVIYETEPSNLKEALAKLRFIARLVVDGVEFESDFFAFMIEECTDIAEMSAQDMVGAERAKLQTMINQQTL